MGGVFSLVGPDDFVLFFGIPRRGVKLSKRWNKKRSIDLFSVSESDGALLAMGDHKLWFTGALCT